MKQRTLSQCPNLDKEKQSRLKCSISRENFAISLEIFNLDLQKTPLKYPKMILRLFLEITSQGKKKKLTLEVKDNLNRLF